ncbi:kelch-like protein 26 [Hyalella azteca]|uniref:Kelch-like protein diablo n=1 Tax=Hyalella azteca TaxID=294128 RepID=A0A8B7P0S5_HYAAZ|nr:kelch-like protein 26 [Hyalella azteca]
MLQNMTRYRNSLSQTMTVDVPSHTSTLLEGLTHLRAKNLLLDVTLIAEGEEFQAHRLLLAACSDYFRAMFTDEMLERQQENIVLHGVSAVGLESALEYIYSGSLSLEPSTVQDVLDAASHLQLPAVQQACARYLQDHLDVDNCVDVASLAETYSLTQLRAKAYAVMCSQLRRFSGTAEFQRLSDSQLVQLLCSDHPVDCSEGEVATAVSRWLSHCPSRDRHARHLLSYVNWKEVPEPVSRSLALPCPLPLPLLSHQPAPPKGLLNTRGLELAILKVGGFSIAGITNEITYRLSDSGSWRHLTTIPHVEQCNFGTAVLDNELYVVGGCFDQSLQENIHPFGFRYSAQSDKWSTIAPMLRERCRFSLTALDEKLYAVGGESEDTQATTGTECEVYHPEEDVWHQLPQLGCSRAQHAAAALNRCLYVTGGLDLTQDSVLSSCWAYSTVHQVWTRLADMPTPRADHAAFVYDNSVWVCGGWHEDSSVGHHGRQLVATVDRYDVATDTWHTVTTVPTPRYHAGVTVIGSRLHVMGGFLSDVTFDRATGVIETYDLDTGTWLVQTPYPRDIWEHACVSMHVPRCRDNMAVMLHVR